MLRVDFKKRGVVREMSPGRCGGNQAHFEKEDKPQPVAAANSCVLGCASFL